MNTSRQQGADTQQGSGFFTNVQIVSNTINWLVDLIQLTEEEQKEAGICSPGN